MSPRPPCQPKKAVRQPIVDEEETADDESSVENQEISTDDEEEEEDCDFEGGVMVKEVWDTKGATLKWAMAPVQHCPPLIDNLLLSQNHQLVVYIVQMRQLLRLQPNMVADEWKTITATTHTTTNLKYVLTLGLHYQVRVIAMSARGICSATQESRPFGLPKGHPSPGPPRNLRYADYNRAGGGVLGNTIHWDPPSFSIPISHYLITWFVHDSHRRHNQHQSSETLQAHTSRLRHHLHASRHPPLHPHVVVPGKRRTYRIRNLLNGHIYTVQIQAVARLGDTDIYGEPAALKIHTFNLTTTRSSVQVSESTTTTTPPSTTNPSRFNANIINLNISRIFFENGILQAKIQWNYTQDANHEVKQFFIRVHSPLCRDIFQLDHSPRGEHERHYYAPFSETSHLILDLRFDCIYQVGVVAVSERGLHGSETAITIETPHCHQVQVQGDIGPDCPPSAPHHFWCNMDRQTRVMAATCHWTYRHIHSNSTTFRGFHIVANTHQSPHRHGGPLKNTSTQMFVNKDARQVVLTELVPNNKYHVTIRVVGENGYGPNAHAHFFASSPPFYHGSHHPVTYQAWQTNGSKSGHLINNLICLVLLTLIPIILQKSRYRL